MTGTLAIIHTTPVTVESMKAPAAEFMPGCTIINWVDDSILPQLAKNGGNVSEVKERLTQYTRFAEQAGADVILHACSSVGGLVSDIRNAVSVPVIRIDEAMAEAAVQRGPNIIVAATLATTLRPTLDLLRQKASEMERQVTITPLLVDSAYQRLIVGDREGHDTILAEALTRAADEADVVVLAQASMARVLATLPPAQEGKFLTSPRLAMGRVKEAMESQVG